MNDIVDGGDEYMNSRRSEGLKLKVLRVEAGVRQLDVALRLGCSASRLSLIENGYSRVDKKALRKIEEAITGLKGER